MEILTTPPVYVPVQAPAWVQVRTARHESTAGLPTTYALRLAGAVPSGAQVQVAGVWFRLLTDAGGYDPHTAGHVRLPEPFDALVLGQALWLAVQLHSTAAERLVPVGLVPDGPAWLLVLQTRIATAPVGLWAEIACLAPGGAPYTSPSTDPLTIAVQTAGVSPVRRAGYAVEATWLVAPTNDSSALQPLRRVRQTPPARSGAVDYWLDLAPLARPELGFDLPRLQDIRLQHAHRCARFALLAVGERKPASDADAHLRPYTTPEGWLQGFVLLNARGLGWASLPALVESPEGCPTDPSLLPPPLPAAQAPDTLAPWCQPAEGQAFRFMSPLAHKRSFWGATEYLAFFANATDPAYASPGLLGLRARVYRGSTVVELPLTLDLLNRLDCHSDSDSLAGKVWLLPLAGVWPLLATHPDLPFPPADLHALELALVESNPQATGPDRLPNGGFEDGSAGWTLAGPQPPSIATLGTPDSGTQYLRFDHSSVAAVTGGSLLSAPLALPPGEWEWQVRYAVEQAGEPGSAAVLGLVAPAGHTELLGPAEAIPLSTDTPGYLTYSLRFRTLQATSLQLAIGTETIGEVSFLVDSMRLRAWGYRAVTEWFRFELEPICPDTLTLLYCNRLGVAETLHLRASREEVVRIRQQLATTQPERVRRIARSSSLVWRTDTETQFTCQTLPLPERDLPRLRDLAASTELYLLLPPTDTPPNAAPGWPPALHTPQWQPVRLADRSLRLQAPTPSLRVWSFALVKSD
jgi:hypothetical protein